MSPPSPPARALYSLSWAARALALLSCLFSVCACGTKAPPSSAKVEWYIASQEPLTYCPKGHTVPTSNNGVRKIEFVYLADRRTRFYIPDGCMAHRAQALDLRWKSRSWGHKSAEATMQKVNLLLSGMLQTVVAIGSR
ncbi:MAG: hypothetical protein JNG86_01765 [Verrucomicrobiaceae bacterium]|nr:hypothetical protein [Verrucomicrobiaceae bacterium]